MQGRVAFLVGSTRAFRSIGPPISRQSAVGSRQQRTTADRRLNCPLPTVGYRLLSSHARFHVAYPR